MTIPKNPSGGSLCEATYRAQQIPGAVLVFADGMHPTSGYVTFFEQTPIDVFPPEFVLWHIKPSGIVLQVLTPFSVHVSFNAPGEVKRIVVHDANGPHQVDVEQVPDAALQHQ